MKMNNLRGNFDLKPADMNKPADTVESLRKAKREKLLNERKQIERNKRGGE